MNSSGENKVSLSTFSAKHLAMVLNNLPYKKLIVLR